ncbi:hypothetical protein ACFQZJ_12350 [Maribacter chungangensis]|uniref:Uncharacterized protein n=1 Tax=Maribacter chungangensis TaxID=1069117 RepID=A0ABW3B6S6_9FLAO
MKTLLTFMFVLLINATAVAQHTKNHDKVNIAQMDVVLVGGLPVFIALEKTGMETQNNLVRLYRYKNSRVKKALSFKTKKDKPKLA